MFASEALIFFRNAQHYFNDQILGALESIKQDHAILTYAGLALIGFLYGALHAIGPGHGKVVVTSYLLANENSLRRGLVVVGLSAFLQAVVAIVLVVGFYSVLRITRAEAESIANLLEVASTCLIGLLGGWLAVQGAATLQKTLVPSQHHQHPHAHGECCNHAHIPSPQQLDEKRGITSQAAMILSIGIRPCTGALLLLFFSCALDLVCPGILATFAMAAGTALTTGALAMLTVKSKALALRYVKTSGRGLALAHGLLRLVGGLAIMALAIFFLGGGWNAATPSVPAQHPLFRASQ